MAGFLDPKERVLDMVLTDLGKTLLLKGDLNFVYWIPFDDEVDYNPPTLTTNSFDQTIDERRQELTESPLIREATMGYRGLNLVEEDLTNVHRPMFTAPPGVGHMTPLPYMVLSTGSAAITVSQKRITKTYEQRDPQGNLLSDPVSKDVGVQRYESSEVVIDAKYSTGSYPVGFSPEGFLVTVYQSSTFGTHEVFSGSYLLSGSGGFQEIINTRNSDGQIAYRNDLALRIIK